VQEEASLAFGLDDALVGWLVASAGDSMLRALRGNPATKALRQLVETAVDETVVAVAEHLNSEQAEHLRLLLREQDTRLSGVTVSSVTGLRAALRAWTAALDRRVFGGSRYLADLGIDADRLGDELADRVTEGIRERGRAGGPLGPLADWLWRDGLSTDVGQIKENLSQLRNVVEPPRSYGGGLPGVTPDFTGRQQVLEELGQRVQAHDPEGVVVAVHAVDGMPGVGKTELALRVAHQYRQRYPDDQYFIDLHGYTEGIAPMSATAALAELLRQAGMPGPELPADLAGRQARWRALMARRRALVLLDNALDADQVRPLLPRAAGCLVLITSRSVLRSLPGARTLRLDVLPQEEAIELFLRVADSDKPLDRQAVAKAVDLVGRLPVAVRAVASQVEDGYSESELAGELARAKEHAIQVAAGPLGSEVRAAFDTSLHRLDPLHQRAFGILGLHPGPAIGVPQFAALASVPVTEASSILRALSRGNLITPYTGVGHRRYQQHDLLRDHARQCASAHLRVDERSAALAQVTAWYASAIMLVEHLLGADDAATATRPVVAGLELDGAAQAREWVASEENNLLALVEHASGHTGAAVGSRYGHTFLRLYRHASAQALYASAARLYREVGDHAAEADALLGVGKSALAAGDVLAADGHLRTALDLYRRTGNQQGEADALVGLGRVGIETRSYAAASADLRAALALYRRAGDQRGEDDMLFWLGELEERSADLGSAGYLFARFDRAAMLVLLGRTALGSAAAGEHFRRALAIARETADEHIEAEALKGLGHAALKAHEYPAAVERLREALDLYRQAGNRYGEADALAGLGDAASAMGDDEAACGRWRAALATIPEVDSYRAESIRAKIEQLCPEPRSD
jgi:tetratricopeptide (TPR) repeat protein